MRFATKAIHVGQKPDPETGAVIPPIYMSSTFVNELDGESNAYKYTRHNNPNYTNLELTLASLENAKYATVYSSGIGGISSFAASLKQGDRIIAYKEVYGGTYSVFTQVFKKLGLDFHLITDHEELEKYLNPPTKLLILESPTNPLLNIIDIAKTSALAKQKGVTVVVDNTFATSFFQQPLVLGADASWHSTTKYIGGHSDIIGGAIITNSEVIKKTLDFQRLLIGVNPSPFDTWLVSRGLKTLALRMKQHERNGLALAQFFENHPKVKKVYHPGLPSHPGYEIAKKQMSGYSGMFSVDFDLNLEQTHKLLGTFKLFTFAISLGGVESLVNHPATMSHGFVPKEERLRLGISDSLGRFSAGVEDTDDLLEDVSQALNKI
jgi:cystathionine beta-lyase/cystathionine gamma-synthase